MKKLTSLSIVIILMLSLCLTAFAQENVGTGAYNADVTGTYVEGATSETVFSVDIAWTDLSFTYHAEQQPVWNAETHKYSDAIAAYWEGTGTITVTNHSNAKITATPTYNKGTGYESANMTFSTDKLSVASAESGAAQVGTITVTPTGSLPANTENQTIGTITLAIAEDTTLTVNDFEALAVKMDALIADAQGQGYDAKHPTEYTNLVNARKAVDDNIDVFTIYDPLTEDIYAELESNYESISSTYHAFKALTGL